MDEKELYHHGVKGQKWGVRRYQNKDGSLTPAGIKRYAQKGYAQDSLKSNKTAIGKAYDAYTGTHKQNARDAYERSSEKKNKARAERYLADKEARKQKAINKVKKHVDKEKVAKAVGKGAEVAAKAALMSATDDIFYGGAGKRIAKETIKQTGRAVVTAYTMANGGYDIRWYDN